MPGPRSNFFAWLLLSVVCASFVSTVAAQDAPAPSSTAPVPSDKDLAKADCILGEERFLPGDYYYCLGSLTYGQHNYGESKRFFTTAASWASKPAQFVLGVMALNGDHQPRDRALALAWFALASERPNSRFSASYDQVYKASTMQERRAADVLLEKMRPIYGDATAAVRAEKRYHDGMAMLQRQDTPPGQMYCMEGMQQLNGPTRPCQPVMMYSENIDKAAVNVFDGWTGHVTVGPLEQVPAPGKSAGTTN
jgi:hypothetical protein